MRRHGREVPRGWAPRGSMKAQAPQGRAAGRRLEAGCGEGGTEAGRDFGKSTGAVSQPNGEGRRNPEPGTQSLIRIPICHLHQQGALGKSPDTSKINS